MLLLLGKIALALLPLIAILLLLMHFFLPSPDAVAGDIAGVVHKSVNNKLVKLLSLMPYAGAALLGFLLYGMMLRFLRVEEIELVLAKIRGRVKKTAT